VLPRVALATNSPPINVPVNVSVKVIVVVDVYIAVLPITIAPVVGPCGSQNDSGSEGQPRAGVVSRIGVRIIGIGRRRRSVNHLRVV
jgi:hypothetical protein